MPSTSGQAWFLTIVVLVVSMRLILVPLFVKQMHSMRKMSALNAAVAWNCGRSTRTTSRP